MSSTVMDASVETWSGKDRGDENFPVGSFLIRRALRRHVHAYYTFARNADDIADSRTLPAAEKIARLNCMEDVLLGRHDAGAPSATRLRASLAETGVDPRHATDLLIAFRQDATKLRYADWNELLDYCRTSAMPVGRYVLDLHGESRETHVPSDALCAALQVLNHIQDCGDDLRELDRSYLPEQILHAHGTVVNDVLSLDETAGLRATFNVLLDQVDALNRTAEDLPRLVRSRGLRIETAMIVRLSRRLAHRLRHNDPVAGRVKLTKPDFARAMLGATLGSLLA